MLPRRFVVALLALPAACVATAVTAEGPVRLYTNADLQETASMPVAARVENTDWDFVADFIYREHERLEAERSHELDRRRVEIEEGEDAFPSRSGPSR